MEYRCVMAPLYSIGCVPTDLQLKNVHFVDEGFYIVIHRMPHVPPAGGSTLARGELHGHAAKLFLKASGMRSSLEEHVSLILLGCG